ncbi:heme ABC transporter permease [Sneathiella sp. CAU 1612]|uniref:Heme exporter protein C n=1 Tax=Sneathiella sedimenti TaxID=2816034 RepID=A0ABS3F1S5_9PROT|nr:heme ABC transporter permease [Sneathiella sedimenti]MBO0332461.1 heme ABC transporter permease [Sneathiella sedimenti]
MAIDLHKYANPKRFLAITGAIYPWSVGLTVVLLLVGLYLSLFVAPPDYQQGDTVRIMFVHVPAAWMALMIYTMMAISSAVGLIWKHPVADLTAKASAPIGACFTFLALVTGSLWGQPMWGTFWVWDARLTSMLILLFLYLGYMAIWESFDDPVKAAKAAAILALVGVINIPIIRFSVDWWNTLHQPASVATMDGPKIHSTILIPLLVMGLAYTAFFVMVLIIRVKAEILKRRLRVLQIAELRES